MSSDVTGGWARGCGASGLGLREVDTPECTLDHAINWTVCWCGEDDCNSLDKTEHLLRFIPTTTTTTTTTSTTTTTTTSTTTTTTTTVTLAKKPLFQPTFVFSSSNSPEYSTSTTASVKYYWQLRPKITISTYSVNIFYWFPEPGIPSILWPTNSVCGGERLAEVSRKLLESRQSHDYYLYIYLLAYRVPLLMSL